MSRVYLPRWLTAAMGARAEHWAERVDAAALRLLWRCAAALSPERASRFGGQVLALIGPRLRKNRQVLVNLAVAFPDADRRTLRWLARETWRNAGQVLAEYPHLGAIFRDRTAIEIHPETRRVIASGGTLVFVGGHCGNWEVIAAVLAAQFPPGRLSVVYSAQLNEQLDTMLQDVRQVLASGFIEKRSAVRTMLRALADGESLGLLPDQRVDSGVMIDLFGRPAPTTISPARLALRNRSAYVPMVAVREGDARIRVIIEAPLQAPPGSSGDEAAIALTRGFHELLETWIRAYPGQWLCTKRRWPKPRAE